MARIALKHCVIRLVDGLAGTAAVNQMMTAPMSGDASLTIDTVVLNTTVTTKVPVGARFTIAGESASTVHTVTGRTGMDTTTAITFSPPLGAGTYADNGVITFLPQQLEIKIGDGNVTYTESDEYNYLLDRSDLDTVTSGDAQPMQVNVDCVYESITTGTSESIAPMDALKRRGSASEWVSSATDKCEPYAVDLEVIHTPPCGTKQAEKTTFPDFRSESREVNFQDATISVSGRCNAVEPIVERASSFA